MNKAESVGRYVDAWSKTTEPEILSDLESCWTSLSTYTDPITETTRGPVELARVIVAFHKNLPGGVLSQTSGVDVHHEFGRFSWKLTLPAPVEINGVAYPKEMDGFDFVEFEADSPRILKVVGFFGPFPK